MYVAKGSIPIAEPDIDKLRIGRSKSGLRYVRFAITIEVAHHGPREIASGECFGGSGCPKRTIPVAEAHCKTAEPGLAARVHQQVRAAVAVKIADGFHQIGAGH